MNPNVFGCEMIFFFFKKKMSPKVYCNVYTPDSGWSVRRNVYKIISYRID